MLHVTTSLDLPMKLRAIHDVIELRALALHLQITVFVRLLCFRENTSNCNSSDTYWINPTCDSPNTNAVTDNTFC